MNDKELDDVLKWVNAERTYLGMTKLTELPKGEPQIATCCVIARALDGESGSDSTWRADGCIEHPPYVKRFIQAFDEGKYPHLVDDLAA